MKIKTKKHSSPKIFIFDLDGTLANSLPTALNAANTLRYIFGYKKIIATDPRLRLISGFKLAQKVLGLSVPKMIIWLPMIKFLVEQRVSQIPIFEGWLTTLKTLQKKHQLGLLTSSRKNYALTVLKKLPEVDFEFMSFGAAYHRKAIALDRLIEEHNLKKPDIIYVGDEVRDFECCKTVGVKFLAVTWGKDDISLFKKPDGKTFLGFLNSPKEILKFV